MYSRYKVINGICFSSTFSKMKIKNGSASYLNVESAQFKSELWLHVHWKVFLLCLLSPFRQILGEHLRLGHNCLLPHLYDLLFIYCRSVLCCVIWTSDSVIKYSISNKIIMYVFTLLCCVWHNLHICILVMELCFFVPWSIVLQRSCICVTYIF